MRWFQHAYRIYLICELKCYLSIASRSWRKYVAIYFVEVNIHCNKGLGVSGGTPREQVYIYDAVIKSILTA